MPTGSAIHYVAGGDRTTPLPTTTYTPPREPKKFVWPVQDYAEPTTPPPTPPPAKKTPKPHKTPTPRKRLMHTCDCGRPRSPQSKKCSTCYHTSRIMPRGKCIDCGTTIGIHATRCRPCQGRHASTHPASNNKPHDYDPELAANIRVLYIEQHLSMQHVADRLEVTCKIVRTTMLKAGIPARQRQAGCVDTLRGIRTRLQDLGVTSTQVRQWARDSGVPVGVRGVVPTHVLDAYEKAHTS